MQVQNIINTEVANIANCESEPIHIPGSIQPHGFLIAIDKTNYRITYVSENTEAYIGKSYLDLLGSAISQYYSVIQFEELRQWLDLERDKQIAPMVAQVGDKDWITSAYDTDNLWVLEYEPYRPDDEVIQSENIVEHNKRLLKQMQDIHSLQQLCQNMAEEIKRSTGYDRVMVYRFDTDYNGEVFAESKEAHLEPFLGLHYPHTDIPIQARKLYLTNLIRVISDVNYQPVPIYTKDDKKRDHRALDLSRSNLRSTSPIHVEYLQNMGVGATLTISLIIDGNLWGLVACHHYSTKELPYQQRIIARLQAYLLTAQIPIQEKAANLHYTVKADQAVSRQLSMFQSKEQFVHGFEQNQDLLNVTNADAAILQIDEQYYQINCALKKEVIAGFVHNIYEQYDGKDYDTNHIAHLREENKEEWATYPGVMFRRLSEFRDDAIIWLRKERREHITWAGDPAKAIAQKKEADGVRLSPRKSFEKWITEVKGHAHPWLENDRKAASTLSFNLRKLIFLEHLQSSEREYKMLNQKLQDANEELSILNWVSTHDLKEPLRKIQLFTSKILSTNEITREDNLAALQRIIFASSRMSKLLDDINSYTKVGMDEQWEIVNLDALLSEIILAKQLESEAQPVFEVGPLPKIKGIPFQLRQLFENLISNAIKFSAVTPEIRIYCSEDSVKIQGKQFHEIIIKDNGIGFEQQYAEKIFGMFQRLHNKETFEGSGIGLAICRKIVHRHEGTIMASSKAGEGTKMILHFPVLE